MNKYEEKIKKAFEYAIESNYKIFDRQANVRERFAKAKTICFWGTGEFFNDCYRHPGFDFDYVCDNDDTKWGKKFKGKVCISIDELKTLDDVVVLVMVGNYIPIQKQLNEIGIENYNCDDIFLNVYDHKYSNIWFSNNLDNALKVVDILEDEKSREVYTEAICNRIAPHLADKIFNQIKTPGEYFDQDVFSFETDEVMIDAGAFDGDSAENFINKVEGKFDKIYAFEIEENNYKKMFERLKKYKNKIEFINKGVHNCNKSVNLEGNECGSHIYENSDNNANVVTIDSVVNGQKITFIKMDIEGSEIPALEGAKNTIIVNKPKLAISAYHFLNDLWDVPLKILEFNSDYKIYMRHHAPTVWDTDCYAFI